MANHYALFVRRGLVLVTLLGTLLGGGNALAGPLQTAEVHKIVNDVRIVDGRQSSARPAKIRDIIKDEVGVRTGVQSRAELMFQDATLTRLGADTLFSFKAGTRNMSLERGKIGRASC